MRGLLQECGGLPRHIRRCNGRLSCRSDRLQQALLDLQTALLDLQLVLLSLQTLLLISQSAPHDFGPVDGHCVCKYGKVWWSVATWYAEVVSVGRGPKFDRRRVVDCQDV